MPARYYQEKAIVDIKRTWASGDKHALLCSPTGTGKTYIFSMLAKLINENNNKVFVFTHRKKLLDQAGESFKNFGLNPFSITSGQKRVNQNYKFFIGMTKTLQNRCNSKDRQYWIDFFSKMTIIIDECHLQHFNWFFEFIHKYGIIGKIYILGVTATPKRSGKMRQLGLDYDSIIETISVKTAIEESYLVNCDMHSVGNVGCSGINYDPLTGDLQAKSMFKAFNKSKIYKGLINNYEQICPGTKTIIFCCNVEHCIKTAVELHNSGYKAKYVVSEVARPKIPDDIEDLAKMEVYNDRLRVYNLYFETFNLLSGPQDDVLERFDKNEFQFILNVDILTIGYDCPSIETVIIYKKTLSTTLWQQMIGRGSRPSEITGKYSFTVLYFGDNRTDLGEYDDDRNHSLWHEESKGGGLAPVKNCGIDSKGKPIPSENGIEGCKRFIHASLSICPKCGYVYTKKAEIEAELNGFVFDEDSNGFVQHKRVKDMSIDELLEHRARKKHKMPWLYFQLYSRGGIELIEEVGNKLKWKLNTIELAKSIVLRGNSR